MLVKPSIHALRSLHKLKQQDMWQEINKLFEAELQRAYEILSDSREDAALRQMQGRAQFIREFLALVHDAQKHLEKLNDSTF